MDYIMSSAEVTGYPFGKSKTIQKKSGQRIYEQDFTKENSEYPIDMWKK